MDYIDGHAYWQHPHFPGRPWDPANWTVEQVAMVDHPEQARCPAWPAQRLAGKPYTVSEYNHPAPNDYQAECVPMIASFAAAQDWDGVWLFAYSPREPTTWTASPSTASSTSTPTRPSGASCRPGGDLPRGGIAPVAAQKVVALGKPGTPAEPAWLQGRFGDDLFRTAVEAKAVSGWPDMLRLCSRQPGRHGHDLAGPCKAVEGGGITWQVGRDRKGSSMLAAAGPWCSSARPNRPRASLVGPWSFRARLRRPDDHQPGRLSR